MTSYPIPRDYPMPHTYGNHALIASPSTVVRQRVLESLRSPARRFEQASGGAEALVHLESGAWKVLFLDRQLPDLDAEELSLTVRQRYPGIEVVLLAPEEIPQAASISRANDDVVGESWSTSQTLAVAARVLQHPASEGFGLPAFQMLPLNYVASTNTLYLAFGERVDHAALYAIEKILDCRTLPCVAGRESIARQLEAMRQLSRPGDVEFGPISDLAEMASIASSYTARLSPGQVRLSRVGRFIWLRLDVNSNDRAMGAGNTQRSVETAVRFKPRPIATNMATRAFRDFYPVTPSPGR